MTSDGNEVLFPKWADSICLLHLLNVFGPLWLCTFALRSSAATNLRGVWNNVQILPIFITAQSVSSDTTFVSGCHTSSTEQQETASVVPRSCFREWCLVSSLKNGGFLFIVLIFSFLKVLRCAKLNFIFPFRFRFHRVGGYRCLLWVHQGVAFLALDGKSADKYQVSAWKILEA